MIQYFLILFLFIVNSLFTISTSPCSNTMELIKSRGYEAENLTVITEDGYAVVMHRIVNRNSTRPPVLIMHGLMVCSDIWVVRGPKHDLAFLLHDAGFDVWLGNSRGTYYSRKHTILKRFQEKYWDFSWHEVGMYDVPAMIDHMLKITKRDKILHIGHSMGTTSFYVMASKRPEYQKKVAAQISLAPVAYMKNINVSSKLRIFIDGAKFLMNLQTRFRLFDFFARDIRNSNFLRNVCSHSANYQYCLRITFYLAGIDYSQISKVDLLSYICYIPSGTSARSLNHFGQNIVSGDFLEYNFGPKENLLRYNSVTPPQYNLSAIATPVYLCYSKNDYLSSHVDVEKLATKLPNAYQYLIPYKEFNHIDYIVAKDAKKFLYNYVMKVLQLYY